VTTPGPLLALGIPLVVPLLAVLVMRCNSPVMIVLDVPSVIDMKPVLWFTWPKMPTALVMLSTGVVLPEGQNIR